MEYEVLLDATLPAGNVWRVEAIDYERDGACYVTVFYGEDSELRAREYANFKNANATV